MTRPARIPPDSGIDVFRKVLPVLVGPRLVSGTVDMHRVRTRNHRRRGFIFASMPIGHRTLLWWAAFVRTALAEKVDNVIVRFLQLRLREVTQHPFIPAMAVDDDDLLASVARHLVSSFLQKRQLQFVAVGDGP